MFTVGQPVVFGRENGEQTHGTVVKVNSKSIKIRQDEVRGGRPIGTIWRVAPTLVRPDNSRSCFQLPPLPPAPPAPACPEGQIVGKIITKIRTMSTAEVAEEGWSIPRWQTVTVLELSSGVKLYAMQDEEGNGPGVIAGKDRDGSPILLMQVPA